MFFILGLDNGKPQITKSTSYINCPNCHNQRFWNLIREQTHFSLFFLPLVPVKSKYYLACPICNYGRELNKEEYEEQIQKIHEQ